MTPYPLLFEPILKEKVWGGRRLEGWGKRLPEDPSVGIGESWELADLPATIEHGRSRITNGPLAGRSLHDAIRAHHMPIMGSAITTVDGGFPLLVKLLDARENLSIQVHPDEAYVREHPHCHLKSEAWLVLAAEPGAVIYAGLQPDVTPEVLRHRLDAGDEDGIVASLRALPASPGDCLYLPSGTCHALGAGIVVAEVQTPSDTTFRIYDWGRPQRRPLHVEEAFACMRFGPGPGTPPPGPIIEAGGLTSRSLIGTPHFELERLEAGEDGAEVPIVTRDQPEVWTILGGGARIGTPNGESVDVTRGATLLVPARLEDAVARLAARTAVLRVTLPDPTRGLIA
jgi:mannose-6-phosphate isomerase